MKLINIVFSKDIKEMPQRILAEHNFRPKGEYGDKTFSFLFGDDSCGANCTCNKHDGVQSWCNCEDHCSFVCKDYCASDCPVMRPCRCDAEGVCYYDGDI